MITFHEQTKPAINVLFLSELSLFMLILTMMNYIVNVKLEGGGISRVMRPMF